VKILRQGSSRIERRRRHDEAGGSDSKKGTPEEMAFFQNALHGRYSNFSTTTSLGFRMGFLSLATP
jgi:hypothetical protein